MLSVGDTKCIECVDVFIAVLIVFEEPMPAT